MLTQRVELREKKFVKEKEYLDTKRSLEDMQGMIDRQRENMKGLRIMEGERPAVLDFRKNKISFRPRGGVDSEG
jgi:hypothetical protein